MSKSVDQPSRGRIFTIPNLLSLVRIGLIVPFLIFYFRGEETLPHACWMLGLSGLSDLLDGFIARTFHQYSELGELLDPIADKLTLGAVAVCMIVSYIDYPAIFLLFILFMCKEFLMGCGGVVLWSRRRVRPGPAQWYGKAATIFFYLSVITIFVMKLLKHEILWVIWTLTAITAVFMVYAFIRYSFKFRELYRGEDIAKKVSTEHSEEHPVG